MTQYSQNLMINSTSSQIFKHTKQLLKADIQYSSFHSSPRMKSSVGALPTCLFYDFDTPLKMKTLGVKNLSSLGFEIGSEIYLDMEGGSTDH